MFDARLTAPRIQTSFFALFFTACCCGLAAAQAVTTSAEQWRAAGSAPRATSQTATAASTGPSWTLPTGQTDDDSPQTTDDPENPLRQQRKPQQTAQTREPRMFQPPNNVKRMSPAQPVATSNAKTSVPQHNSSAAMGTPSTAPTVARQAYVPPRPMPNNRPAVTQPMPSQRMARATSPRHNSANQHSENVWETINVAFQGQPAPKNEPESLPMPDEANVELQDPMMHNFGRPGEFSDPFGDGPYHPYGQAGPYCGDGCSCGNGCACGDTCGCGGTCGCGDGVCEPGCGSPCGSPCDEPDCACHPGGCHDGCCHDGCCCEGCCEKDLLCLGPGDDEACHTVRIRWPKWQEVMVFGGVEGFKGPYDQDRDSGNFGFNEGFNVGAKVPYALAGYQFGYRGVQSQLNGDKDTDIDQQHFQQFVTAGFFHRSCEGLQLGVVWDMLNDERWHARHFNQLRSEVKIRKGGCHEIGATATIGLNDHKLEDGNGDDIFFQASDQYLLFYRMHGCNGGEGRIFAGGNADSDGIVGSDLLLPLGDRFSVQTNFTYLIPDAKKGEEGASQEAWNIGLGLVWHFDNQARKCHDNCYRPMFNVADNGYLIVDQRDED